MPIKFGAIVTEATGKLGGHYFAGHRTGSVLRPVTTKPHRRSAGQQSQRIAYATGVKAWHNLSQSEIQYYNSVAPHGQTGFNYFISIQLKTILVWDDTTSWNDSKYIG